MNAWHLVTVTNHLLNSKLATTIGPVDQLAMLQQKELGGKLLQGMAKEKNHPNKDNGKERKGF